jgi:hypothetical protein
MQGIDPLVRRVERRPYRWALICDVAWVAALSFVGFASILIDARVGFPAILALIAGWPS